MKAIRCLFVFMIISLFFTNLAEASCKMLTAATCSQCKKNLKVTCHSNNAGTGSTCVDDNTAPCNGNGTGSTCQNDKVSGSCGHVAEDEPEGETKTDATPPAEPAKKPPLKSGSGN